MFSAKRKLLRVLASTLFLTTAVTALTTTVDVDEAQAVTPTTYYVKATGSDSAAGTSMNSAWKSLSKVSSFNFNPGDTILFRRGDTFQGVLRVDEWGWADKKITFSAYGTGNRPIITGACLKPNGNHLVFDDLRVMNCNYDGVAVYGDNVTVQNSRLEGNTAGITAYAGADNLWVKDSTFVNNNRMVVNTACNTSTGSGCNDDYGASGIVVWGDNALIENNSFTGHVANSQDYGKDGSSIELYGAANSIIRNNVATNDLTFTELGSDTWNGKYASNNQYLNNRATSTLPDSSFLITRGAGVFGPVNGTSMANNTAVLVGGGASIGVYCEPSCSSSILTSSGNKIVGSSPAIVEGSWASSSNRYCGEWHNLYVKGATDVQKTYTVGGTSVSAAEAAC